MQTADDSRLPADTNVLDDLDQLQKLVTQPEPEKKKKKKHKKKNKTPKAPEPDKPHFTPLRDTLGKDL